MDDDFVDRLTWLHGKGEFSSKKAASEAYGIGYETYKKIAGGTEGRGLTKGHVEKIAKYHSVSPGWLMFGDGTPEGELNVQLRGFIAAGQEMILFDDIGEQRESVNAIVAGPAAVAFEVRGDSMFPLARDRDVIFVGKERIGREIRPLVGSDCAVSLQDGRRLFKVLERGARDHLFDLHSYNAEPIRGVEVHSARPVRRLAAPIRYYSSCPFCHFAAWVHFVLDRYGDILYRFSRT